MSLEDKLDELIALTKQLVTAAENPSVGVATDGIAKPFVAHKGENPTATEVKAKVKAKVKEGAKMLAAEATTKEVPVETESVEEPEEPVEFDVLHKLFWSMLPIIKAAKGLPEAKKVCAHFMQKYSGGKEVNLENLPPANYDAMYQEVKDVRANYEA